MNAAAENSPQKSVPKIIWKNLLFFISTTSVGLIGTGIYLYHFGISISEVLLLVFYFFVTSFSITVGYHRMFSHASFKAHPAIQFLSLFFGAASFEQSALTWSSQHRKHHRFVDTDYDPYNIKRGFFYAHLGWMIFWEHPVEFDNVQDLKKNSMLMHQHNNYVLWAVTAGIILPVLIGALTGHALGAFLIAFCLRVTLVYHVTWCINSFAHTFGQATYDIDSTAKDFWLTALLTNGEGYHNYHHRFPGDYRNGVRWYDWDPTKWMIQFLARIGLASDLISVSKFRIYAARINSEKLVAERKIAAKKAEADRAGIQSLIKERHERLKQILQEWEVSARDYQRVIQDKLVCRSDEGRKIIMRYLESKKLFQHYFAQWKLVCQKI